jgi:hypothetical protein
MTEQEWLACANPTPMLEFLREKAAALFRMTFERYLDRETLEFLSGRVTHRKVWLFEVACCRRIWEYITDPQSQAVVEITERSADAPIDLQTILALDYDRITDNCGGPDGTHAMAFMVAGHVGYSFIGLIHDSAWSGDDFVDALSTSEGVVQVMVESVEISGADLLRLKDSEEFLPAFRKWQAAKEAAARDRVAKEQKVQSDLLRDIFGNPFRPPTIDPVWITRNGGAVPKLAQAIYAQRRFQDLPVLIDTLEEAGCTNADILAHCRQPGGHVRGCWVVDLLLGKE